MTPFQSSNAGLADSALGEPAPAEVGRVLHLFRNAPLSPEARLLALQRSQPIPRFIAAAAWWPEGTNARFQLACQPGIARAAVAGLLLDGLADAARKAGVATLQYANLLTDGDEWFGLLRARGFACRHSERSFEVAYRDAWQRVMQLYQKHRSRIPAGWRTEAIRALPPEAALALIAPHRLMPPAEIRHYWRADAQAGFELDLSCVLFDGERPFGALLTRRVGDGCYVDVQVVLEANPRLRSLGDLLLLYHGIQRLDPGGPVRWLWFRSGQTEHRQTANFALRMGGRELARAHLLARPL